MKARVKYNNEIIDIVQVGTKTHLFDINNVEIIDDPDYWTRLEYQYAGMFLQAQISYGEQEGLNTEEMVEDAMIYAHALVEKLKDKEEMK